MFVRKAASLVAVATLVFLSVLSGSTAAYAAVPTPPSVDQTFAPWVTSQSQRTVQGNKDPDVTQIDVYVWTDASPTPAPYCTTPATDGATVWFSCAPSSATLASGVNYLAATATNVDGVSAMGAPITITRVAAPTISSPANQAWTSDNTPDLSGTADPLTTQISVVMPGSPNLCSNVPVIGGAWSCTAASPLSDGDYVFFLDGSPGDTVRSGSQTLHVDTVLNPPLAHITSPADTTDPSGAHFAATTDPTPTLSGTAEPLSTITLFRDYSEVGCAGGQPQTDLSGNWTCTLAVPLTASGTYIFGSQHTDRAGNTNVGSSPDEQLYLSYSDVTAPAAPVITSPIDYTDPGAFTAFINYSPPTITGTGEPGAHLGLFVDGSNEACSTPTMVDGSGNWTCTIPGMADGVYQITFTLADEAGNISPTADRFLALLIDTVSPTGFSLVAPVGTADGFGIVHATTTQTNPVIMGDAEDGVRVFLYNGEADVECDGGAVIVGEGGFACSLTNALSPGVYEFSYVLQDQVGNESGPPTSFLELTVVDPGAPAGPPQTPTGPPASKPTTTVSPNVLPTLNSVWALEFTVDSDTVEPGQHVTISAQDLPPGASVQVELHSTPVVLGTTTVKDDGTFTLDGVIPLDVEPGAHNYVVTVTPADGASQTIQSPVTVTSAAEPGASEGPDPSASPTAEPNASGSAAGAVSGSTQRDLPAAPNVLSGALATLQDVISNPLILGAAALSSLALLFLVAVPAEMLNTTLDVNYSRIFGRIRRPRLLWMDRLRGYLRKTPVVAALGLTALVSLILSFSDPEFGFDLVSLRMFLAVTIGMFLLGWVANLLTGVVLQRRWSIGSVIELQPFGIVIALVGVLLSRVLDFSPGLMIGLILALALSASATLKDEARFVLVWSGALLVLSILAWVTYSLGSGLVAPGTFAGALFDDTLVATATEGVSALAVGLLPVGFLDGRNLFRYSKLQWLGTYLVTMVAFFVIVVPGGELWGDVSGPFWLWLTVLIAFAVVAVGVSVWFRTHPSPEGESEAEPDGESALVDHSGARSRDEA